MSTTGAEDTLPTAVDVTPRKGRRVRTPDGALLPEGHILRGEPRSPYWLRLERDRDVKLTPHAPEAEAPAPAMDTESKPPVAAADPVALPPLPVSGSGKKF